MIGDGQLSILNEAEIPSIIYRTFTALGLQRFQIRVNNRKILNGFYAMQGLSEQSSDVMRTVDKLDKIGADKVRAILVDDFGVSSKRRTPCSLSLPLGEAAPEVLAALEGYRGKNELLTRAWRSLEPW